MMDQRIAAPSAGIEVPSGKSARDENFPVGSFLIARDLRPHVASFYRFARAADDIADNPGLPPAEKIARLDVFEAALDTATGPDCAVALRTSLAECGVPDKHARDLLSAFRQDAVKSRYETWDELMGYCALSANPVGRYLMDLHGEDRTCWATSDALCSVLQILNHLQDCAEDLVQMDRAYIPAAMMAKAGTDLAALRGARATNEMRSVFDAMLVECRALIDAARSGPLPRSRRLRAEMRVITDLAVRLCGRLEREDLIAGRVKLSKLDFACASLGGAWTLLSPRAAR